MTTSLSTMSFITDEVENLLKHMKFIQTPSQTRLFKPPPHYQALRSRGENDPIFWKEVATAFLKKKHNTDMARNGHQIHMFQGGPPHEPYFIAINNKDQVIIGPSKKIVATHVVGELEGLGFGLIHEDMKPGKRVLLRLMPHGVNMDMGRGYDDNDRLHHSGLS